jgi:hypothetical protein
MSLFSRTWPNTSNQPALNPITLQPEHKTERMVHARLQRGTLHCAFTYPTSLVRQATRAAGRERCAYVLAISDKKEDRRVPEAEEEPALRRARARARAALRCIVLRGCKRNGGGRVCAFLLRTTLSSQRPTSSAHTNIQLSWLLCA